MTAKEFWAKRLVSRLYGGGTANRVVASVDGTTMTMQQIVNAMVAAGAAIDYSKLNLAGSILAGDLAATATIKKIASLSGTGASGVLEFTSIPNTYRSLMLVLAGRTDAAVTVTPTYATFEVTPTAGAYNYQYLRGNGATTSAGESLNQAVGMIVGSMTGATGEANVPGISVLYFPEYANTSLYKAMVGQTFGVTTLVANGMFADIFSGLWESTAAIDRIRITLGGGNWTTTSRATLYGLPV